MQSYITKTALAVVLLIGVTATVDAAPGSYNSYRTRTVSYGSYSTYSYPSYSRYYYPSYTRYSYPSYSSYYPSYSSYYYPSYSTYRYRFSGRGYRRY